MVIGPKPGGGIIVTMHAVGDSAKAEPSLEASENGSSLTWVMPPVPDYGKTYFSATVDGDVMKNCKVSAPDVSWDGTFTARRRAS